MKTKKIRPITLDLQIASQATGIPTKNDFKHWSEIALQDKCEKAHICIRIVDEHESAELNTAYRRKQGPTNVLSFPYKSCLELDFEQYYLGDIVICAPIVQNEAQQQNLPAIAHWAHMTVHGILHLLGYDHLHEQEAQIMERLEVVILSQLGFDNPYGA